MEAPPFLNRDWTFTPAKPTTPPVKDRRVLPNGEIEEWDRPPGLPDDYVYDPETDCYCASGPDIDREAERLKDEAEWAEIRESARRRRAEGKPMLVTREMLGLCDEQGETKAKAKKERRGGKKKPSGPGYQSLFGDEE